MSQKNKWAILVPRKSVYGNDTVRFFEVGKITPKMIFAKASGGWSQVRYMKSDYHVELFDSAEAARNQCNSLKELLGINAREELQKQWAEARKKTRKAMSAYAHETVVEVLPERWEP